MTWRIAGLGVAVVAIASAACQTTTDPKALLGEWEMTDLRRIEHVSQFARAVTIFREDGTALNYFVDHDGGRTPPDTERYVIDGDTISFGEYTYRYSIAGHTLRLRCVKGTAPEAVGFVMTLHRVRHAEGAVP